MITRKYVTIPLEDVYLITKNEQHLPSKSSLKEMRTLKMNQGLYITLYRWNNKFFYVSDFYEIALRKEQGYQFVKANINNHMSKEGIIYTTLVSSFKEKVGVQKLNQFCFDLVQELNNPSINEIEMRTGLPKRKIKEFSFHKDMSQKGKKHAEEQHDLTMMNKIWGSPVLCKKSPHVRSYIEDMRISGLLTSFELSLIEKYARSVNVPFQKRKSIYVDQIMILRKEKDPREQILFKDVEIRGFQGKTPPAA